MTSRWKWFLLLSLLGAVGAAPLLDAAPKGTPVARKFKRRHKPAAVVVSTPTAVSEMMDMHSLSLFGRRLSPNFRLGYLDSENNTHQSGEVRSTVNVYEDPGDPDGGIMEMRFTVPPGWNNYCGWYIANPKGVDLSGKAYLQFDIKVHPVILPKILQIGIRSRNVPAADNKAKVFISDLGIDEFPDGFITLRVPIYVLQEKEPRLDLKDVEELFILSVVSPGYEVRDLPVWVRSVRWDPEKNSPSAKP